jgi:hypothetical protein
MPSPKNIESPNRVTSPVVSGRDGREVSPSQESDTAEEYTGFKLGRRRSRLWESKIESRK